MIGLQIICAQKASINKQYLQSSCRATEYEKTQKQNARVTQVMQEVCVKVRKHTINNLWYILKDPLQTRPFKPLYFEFEFISFSTDVHLKKQINKLQLF